MFLVTEPEFLDLDHPPEIHRAEFEAIFGRVPNTLNPPEITSGQMDALLEMASSRTVLCTILVAGTESFRQWRLSGRAKQPWAGFTIPRSRLPDTIIARSPEFW